MTNAIDAILMQLADQFPEQYNHPLVLSTGYDVETAMGWVRAVYPGDEKIPYASIPLATGQALFFFLDGRRMTSNDLISKLSDLGLAVEPRKIGWWPAVYVPPQSIARGRSARYN